MKTPKQCVAWMRRWCCADEIVVCCQSYTGSSYKYIYMRFSNYRYGIGEQDNIRETEVSTNLARQSNIRQQERFLKGPIPLRDIAAAARLPGQALALYLAVHHRTALTGKDSVTLPAALLADLGISRNAKARGLKHLEQSGLITVARSIGRAARVQLKSTTGGNKWVGS